jgi:regulator of sigma E protease
MKGPFVDDSAAAKADKPFEFGDHIVATSDPDHPGGALMELPDDPRFPKHGHRDFFEYLKRCQLMAGKNMVLRVQRGEAGQEQTVDITMPPTYHHTLGVRMEMGHITNIRDDSPAAKAGVLMTRKDGQLQGDLIQKVQVTEPDEAKSLTIFDKTNLDPERLPFQLRQWAERMEKAKAPRPWIVTLTVRRHKDFGEGAGQQFEPKTLELAWDSSWRFDRMSPMQTSSPEAIPELGLAYQIKTIVADVIPEMVKDNPLQARDVIRQIQVFSKDPDVHDSKATLKEEAEQWASIAATLQHYPAIKKIVLKVYRNEKEQEVTIVPVMDKTWPTTENGLVFYRDTRRQEADSTIGAIEIGLLATLDKMKQVFQTVRGMIIGTISPDQLGGPVTIARVAYFFAKLDFWEFVFFLGFISVNLAVINFLPIPVLDGGHMVFLIYEKIRGKPPSEGVRIGATYAGLALILCLMVFVLYLDFSRLFG